MRAFRQRIALVTSFAAEGVVLLDMLSRIDQTVRILTLDTGRLPAESYAVIEAIRERYHVTVEVLFPQTEAVEAMVREHGVNLFYRSVEARKLCCAIRKVEPIGRALVGLEAWIAGLRRDQAVTRGKIRKVEVNADHGGSIKINPLADWTWPRLVVHPRARRAAQRATTRGIQYQLRTAPGP
jgi:phosphoadenosine phosphosulfate reductase